MADIVDPYAPVSDTLSGLSNIGQQWSDALNDPVVRTSLLQFGVSLMQPPASFGDTGTGQVGRAIGSAGEALTRGQDLTRKDELASSKMDLESARSEAAAARAGAATTQAGAAAERVGVQRERLSNDRERMRLQDRIQFQNRQVKAASAYERYATETRKDILNPREPMARDEWYRANGFGDLLGGAPGGGAGAGGTDELRRQAQDVIQRSGNDPETIRRVKEHFYSLTGESL